MLNFIKKRAQALVYRQVLAAGRDLDVRHTTYLGRGRLLTTTKRGERLILNADDLSVTPHVVQTGEWERETTRAMESLLHLNMNYLEIGCNIGYYSTLAGRLIGEQGKLWLFEANPHTYGLLSDNVQINNLHRRATVENMAVSNRDGVLQLRVLHKHLGSCRIYDFSDDELNEWAEDVPTLVDISTVSLDRYFAGQNPRIDFVKIDAEGAEALIIAGMEELLGKHTPMTILLEFSPKMIVASGEDPSLMLTRLEQHGFRFHLISHSGRLERISCVSLLDIEDLLDIVCTRS